MHVLIYDPLHKGHHLVWVRLLIDACARLADRVTFATTPEAAASDEYAAHIAEGGAAFDLDDSVKTVETGPVMMEGFQIARRAWLELRAAIRRHRPDHVFVPFGDNLIRAPLAVSPGALDLGLPAAKVDAIFLAGAFAYHRDLPLKRRLRSYVELACMHRLPFGRLLFIDPIVHTWLADHVPAIARRCVLSPDPVGPVRRHEKLAARQAWGLPRDGRLLSCVGVLDARKGVDELIRAFAAAPLRPDDRLLLAGEAKPEVRAATREAEEKIGHGRIVSVDRLLGPEDMELAVSAADVVAVTHQFPAHIGSATILIRATAAQRPVLASELGWPGFVTEKYRLGTIYPQEPSRRPAAIAQALDQSKTYRFGPDAEAFADFHTGDKFGEVLTSTLS